MKANKNLISVLAVNWNGEKWIERFLKSIEDQNYKKIEIIFVDNASTDNSVNIVRKLFPGVKIIINKKNYGLAKAINIGLSRAAGEYVVFMNNDTWVDKNFIEQLSKFYKKNDFMVVSAVEKRYDKDIDFKCNTTIDPTGSPAYFTPTYRDDKLFYLTVCFFCKKSDYIKTLGLDNDFFMYYEDVDWFWRLSLLGKKFAVAKNCVIYHAGAGSTGTGIKYETFLWRNQNTLQSLIKNYSTLMLLVILPLYIFQNVLEILLFLLLLKPRISLSYIEGWTFNLKNIDRILKKRKWVQKKRVVSDWEIIKKMYWGPAKFKMLLNYNKI